MANATSKAQCTTTEFSGTTTKRGAVSTAQTYYPGTMLAVNSTGYVTKCDDTSGLTFIGLLNDSRPITVDSGGSNGDQLLNVQQPMLLQMKIAAAVVTDVGRKVYALYDNEVAYSGVSNSILVGVVHRYVDATTVEIRPYWVSTAGVSSFDSATLTFTGSTGGNTIAIPDNLADALSVVQGANKYLTVTTTDGSELTKVLGPAATGVSNAGGGVQVTGGIGGATSGTGGSVVAAGGAGTNGNSAGGLVSATGGAGQGSAAGGASSIVGGVGGATGAGGAAAVTGGASGATSGTGGAVTIVGGASPTSGTGGAVTITAGASTTSGGGGAVTVTGGAGGGGTNAGGHVNLVGGAAVSTGLPGEVQVNGNAGLIPVLVALTATDASRAVFIATRACRLKAVSYMHTTGSTSGTLQVEKLTGTTAAGSGTTLLTGTIDLSATTVANTTTNGTLIATVASLTLAAGDRLSVKIAGTMTNLVGAIVTMMVAPA